MPYIHERTGWPDGLGWDRKKLAEPLAQTRHRQGRLIGRMEGLGFPLRDEAALQTLTQDVMMTSAIEGEELDLTQVRSSLARKLGIEIGGLVPADRHIEGIVDMTLDATRHYDAPLTQPRLLGWHASLFPTGYSGLAKIAVGRWRRDGGGPMQVVSGPLGREHVHYQAPNASRIPEEMRRFLKWFNQTSPPDDPVLRAGIAHLWFVTIHPFEDGNGRIARAVADMALARSEGCAQRFYSMSAQLRQERNGYYAMLEETQKGGLDVTPWLAWFLACLDRAFDGAERTLAHVLRKARFWEACSRANLALNERQRLMLNRLLDGFEGKMTSSKWAKLAKCSQDTALRDIDDLMNRGLLVREQSGGRSTSYALMEEA